jgi:hypothetical protein
MMDELRDHRFYAEDIHPSQVAIDYIWKRLRNDSFRNSLFYNGCRRNNPKSLQHAFNPDSESHQKFEVKLKTKITKLVVEYPFMKF